MWPEDLLDEELFDLASWDLPGQRHSCHRLTCRRCRTARLSPRKSPLSSRTFSL